MNDRNDSDEPDWMAVNPTGWLFSTKSACCASWFAWSYYECMKDDDCNEGEALFYPDWEDTMSCIDDGKEPYWMHTGHWMKNTREECCEEFFEWEYNDCIGPLPARVFKYYPDFNRGFWDGDEPYCLNDGKEPSYMLNSLSYLLPTLEECCRRFVSWDYYRCVRMGPSAVVVVSVAKAKWYVDWFTSRCVQDCNGEWPCGGVAAQWDILYDDKKTCCDILSWVDDDECVNGSP